MIDVRSFPRSRYPCFNQAPVRTSLNRRGIAYLHLGDQLGGHVVDQAASYTHRITLPEFHEGIGEVMAVARRCRPALLCAEGEPLDCHRAVVIARYLVQTKQADLGHILRDGRLEPHADFEDRLLRRAGLQAYLFADRAERLATAYAARLLRMGLGAAAMTRARCIHAARTAGSPLLPWTGSGTPISGALRADPAVAHTNNHPSRQLPVLGRPKRSTAGIDWMEHCARLSQKPTTHHSFSQSMAHTLRTCCPQKTP